MICRTDNFGGCGNLKLFMGCAGFISTWLFAQTCPKDGELISFASIPDPSHMPFVLKKNSETEIK
jgi:hypothetical protein